MKTILTSLIVTISLLTASAENWPSFRGPTRQGMSTERDLPLNWSADSNIAWKTEIPGNGWSSPIVWGDKIFVTSTLASDTKCHVICVDRKSGKILWNKEVFEQVPRRKESKNSYATPTAATDGQHVFVVFGDGSMAALTLDGEIVWTNREVKFYSRHGLGASPIIYSNLVIMPFDGSNPIATAGNYPQVTDEEKLGWQIPWDKAFIAALDTKTGKRVWTAKRGMSRIAHISPIIADDGEKDVLVSAAGDRVQGFNPLTGEMYWTAYAQGEGVTPTPVYGDGRLFASSGFEKTTLRCWSLIRAKGDITTNTLQWEGKKGVPTQPSPIYVKPYLYAITDGGIATCFAPDDGEIIWQERVGGNHSASPVYGDRRIYFLSEEGETTVINAGSEFKILAKNALKEKCQASMAISQGQIFIRGEKNVYCIGKK
ncbi:MAG: PQQ-binding-like beta-propeller repeat protein [Verrucomicrobia bacterium]|nr:PQQ-binding-like beta-propeller repeat protein [Verrucomicrobiota bacterium]